MGILASTTGSVRGIGEAVTYDPNDRCPAWCAEWSTHPLEDVMNRQTHHGTPFALPTAVGDSVRLVRVRFTSGPGDRDAERIVEPDTYELMASGEGVDGGVDLTPAQMRLLASALLEYADGAERA